jgi:hypothetical protein
VQYRIERLDDSEASGHIGAQRQFG